MKRIAISSILGISSGIILLIVCSAFIITGPQLDYYQENVEMLDRISLSEIQSDNLEIGTFKTSVNFSQQSFDDVSKEFYGQEIFISNNPKVDRILIGITNNLVSRLEIWNQDKLIESKELGFMDKMTWGETQTMTVDFYDQNYSKYKGKNKISMRFFNWNGFLGDIGTINFDLTEFGDLSGPKTIGFFAKALEPGTLHQPEFSDLKIWRNYNGLD